MKDLKEKLGITANVVIIVTLLIVLISPSGVVGGWISERYEGWQQRRKIASLWPALTEGASKLEPASPDPHRTIVEFIDYECPSCRNISPAVSGAVHREGVTIVMRHLPLTQIHARARGAATVAVCAELHGHFGETHEALMDPTLWAEESAWDDFAANIDPDNAEDVRRCIVEGEADARLVEDANLAASLGVAGTPTFVTPKGLFVGAEGWERALESLPRATHAQEAAPRRVLSDETAFDSATHPDPAVSELGSVKAALFLNRDELLLVDGPFLHFVNASNNVVNTRGGAGEGPGEFKTVFEVMRAADRIVVRDFALARITSFSNDGELLDTRSYDPSMFANMMAPAVGAFADGAILFRDGRAFDAWRDGLFRSPIRYVELGPDGEDTVLTEAVGDEEYGYKFPDGRRGVHDVIFGNRTLAVVAGETVVLAQTDASAIRVHDRRGEVIAELPMPPSVDVARSHIARAREERVAAARETLHGIPANVQERFGISSSARDEIVSMAPANESAPSIDELLIDADGRLWLRLFGVPREDVVRWQVWDIENTSLRFVVEFDRDMKLLDAEGDRVLLQLSDAFGVDRVEIREMVIPFDGRP